ncbi:MAG: 50S ribosomal protein P1 [Methanosarcinales archaeon Met12]|nr:MAG: 50S ribosomal protein P1 [Methanosarcinales archaeon Met12]
MEYVYAALILHNAGKNVDENGITAVLKAAGIDADMSRVKALVAALDGVNIDEAIAQAAFAPAAPTQAAPTVKEKKEEGKKEEKKEKEEKTEEAGMEGLSALFG